jgi:hypothetical protein
MFPSGFVSGKFVEIEICRPEQMIKHSHTIGFIVNNMEVFCCVETVQGNCANFSQFWLLQVLRARGTGVRRPFFRR